MCDFGISLPLALRQTIVVPMNRDALMLMWPHYYGVYSCSIWAYSTNSKSLVYLEVRSLTHVIKSLGFKIHCGGYMTLNSLFVITSPHCIVHIPDSKVHGVNMGPPGPCRPQMDPMLAPWTLLSGILYLHTIPQGICTRFTLCRVLFLFCASNFYPYLVCFLHWHHGNLTIFPMLVKKP